MSFDEKAGYYDVGGIETIEIIKAKVRGEGIESYNHGCILKYACRVGHKDSSINGRIRDYEKIVKYAQKNIEILENKKYLSPPPGELKAGFKAFQEKGAE